MIEDAGFLLELMNEPGFIKYVADRGLRTTTDAAEYLREKIIPSYEKFGFGFYRVELKESGTPVGICGLVKRETLDAVDVGFSMDEPHDWPEIAALYGELARLTGSPVVELNRAIAVAEAEGPEAGLALVDRIGLDGYQYFHSTRADLLRRLDRADEASVEYERALELAHTEHERRFLERRIAEVRA